MRISTQLVVCIITLVAGCNRGDNSTASTQPIESTTLRKEYEAAFTSGTAGRPANLIAAVHAESEPIAAVALRVTPAEEKKFSAGRFDDDANQKRVDKSIYILKDFGVHLDPAAAFLERSQTKTNRLSGAKLELLARLLEQNVESLKTTPAKK